MCTGRRHTGMFSGYGRVSCSLRRALNGGACEIKTSPDHPTILLLLLLLFVDQTKKSLSAKTGSIWTPLSSGCNIREHTTQAHGDERNPLPPRHRRLPKGFRGPLHPAVVIKDTVRETRLTAPCTLPSSHPANPCTHMRLQAVQLNFGAAGQVLGYVDVVML